MLIFMGPLSIWFQVCLSLRPFLFFGKVLVLPPLDSHHQNARYAGHSCLFRSLFPLFLFFLGSWAVRNTCPRESLSFSFDADTCLPGVCIESLIFSFSRGCNRFDDGEPAIPFSPLAVGLLLLPFVENSHRPLQFESAGALTHILSITFPSFLNRSVLGVTFC